MTRLCLLLCLCALGCGSGASSNRSAAPPEPATPPAPRIEDDAIIDAMLARLGTVASCPGSRRVWCVAASGWSRGEPATLPAGSVALVGVTVGLQRDKPDDELLAVDVALSALVFRPEGEKTVGLITDIPPSNPGEQRLMRNAMSSIARVVRGEDERVKLAPSLVRHLDSLPAQASYPLSRGPDGADWRMTGKSNARIRKVGRSWVAIEVPRAGPEGIFVSVYPE
jgi:hypothetical protein